MNIVGAAGPLEDGDMFPRDRGRVLFPCLAETCFWLCDPPRGGEGHGTFGTHKIGCFVRQMAQSVVVFFPHGVLMLAKMRGLSLQADENLFHPDGDKLFAANQGLAEQLREMIQVESPTVAQRLEEVDIDYLPMIAPWPRFTGEPLKKFSGPFCHWRSSARKGSHR